MFKDDRFISILSGVVLMIAIGTVVQRGGPLLEYFTGEAPKPVLASDQADITAGELARIDVLRNDQGLSRRDVENLVIARAPSCGKVFVQDRVIQYLPDERCVGPQTLTYAVGSQKDRPTGKVAIVVRPTAEQLAAREAAREAGSPIPRPRPADLAAAPAETAAPDAPAGGAEIAAQSGPAEDTADLAAAPDVPEAPEELAALPEQPAALAPDPVRRAEIARPALPQLAPLQDEQLTLSTPAPSAPQISAPAPAPSGLGGIAAPAPAVAAAPVAQPGVRSTQAPQRLTTSLDDPRNNDFAAAASRGGLLSRPMRASTSAAPSPDAVALALDGADDSAPLRGQPGLQLSPSQLAGGSGLDTAPSLGGAPEPSAVARVEIGGLAPAAPAGGLARTDPAPAPAPVPSAPTPPVTVASAPEPTIQRTTVSVLRPRASGTGIERVSELAVAPVGGGDPVRRTSLGSAQPTASFGLAQVNRNPSRFESPGLPDIGSGPGRLDSQFTRGPAPTMAFEEAGRLALVTPESGLGDVRSLGSGAIAIVPVETRTAPGQISPRAEEEVALRLPSGLTFDPDAPAIDPETGQPAEVRSDAEDTKIATLTPPNAACTIPPMLNLHPKPGALTTVTVDAPCFVGDIVILTMQGIEFAARVGEDNKAVIELPGFTASAPATIAFPDGSEQRLDIQFAETDRIIRVALVWDVPVTLELHAIASGAPWWSDAHLRPENPGSQRTARRRGQGYLNRHTPVDGVGSSVRIYTHYVRRSAGPQVVDLLVDYTSRRRVGAVETCGDGRFAAPAFRVVRSELGILGRQRNRLLGAIACDEVENYGNWLDDTVVRDIVVTGR